jgi:O-methyltransferase
MENEIRAPGAGRGKIAAVAVRVWTWQPGFMKRHTTFQGLLPVVVWIAVGVLLYIPASKVFPALVLNELNRVPVSQVPIAVAVQTSPAPSTPEEMYLDLLKKTLTRAQTVGRYTPRHLLGVGRFEIAEHVPTNPEGYLEGGGSNLEMRQEDAETMVGTRQLDNIQFCVTDVVKRHIPGDVIECGAWRGGVTILMRAVLRAYGDTEKSVWVADSFEGLPKPITQVDSNLEQGMMAVSLQEVQENFARYGLLDDRVRFLKGYFNKSLPTAPITKLSVLRADGDLYQSQLDVLNNLYPKLSVGGYAIIDDYFELSGCKRAVDEYRQDHNITEEIRRTDDEGIYWQKLR